MWLGSYRLIRASRQRERWQGLEGRLGVIASIRCAAPLFLLYIAWLAIMANNYRELEDRLGHNDESMACVLRCICSFSSGLIRPEQAVVIRIYALLLVFGRSLSLSYPFLFIVLLHKPFGILHVPAGEQPIMFLCFDVLCTDPVWGGVYDPT